MLPPAIMVVWCFLLLAAAATPLSGPHIADLNILLPPRLTRPVQYRLQGSDGCFSWSWDHHDLLLVQPEYNGSSQCSTSAKLTSIAPYIDRKETAIYATDIQTGAMVRCKVIIDKISKIKIFHHAVKINLDELATLHVIAFDDEDNVFSSLVGVQFSWQLTPKSLEVESVHRLIHVPLKESFLNDCVHGLCGDLKVQLELEDEELGSDLYVVKGIEIGHEIVKAKLLEPQLEYLEDDIILTVAEAMSLDPPSPIYVTLGTLIYYNLRVIHRNALRVIELPSPHHQWSVMNSSVVRVDSMMGTVHSLCLGMTNVVVEDVRVSGHFQASALYVVLPKKLLLYLMPITSSYNLVEGVDLIPTSDSWYVFPGQLYIVCMKVFSEGPESHEILITENTNLILEEGSFAFWDILPVSNADFAKHGWQNSRVLKPYSVGEGTLTASLFYHIENKEDVQVLKALQEVIVCKKVKFSIREQNDSVEAIHIPWVPGIYQEVQLTAIGGCGKLLWLSTDEETVEVTSSGFARAKRPGITTIKVVSFFDSVNYDEVVLDVSLPASMVFLPIYPVDVENGTELKAAVTLKTSDGNYFYQCDAFNFIIRWNVLSERKIFGAINTSDENICEVKMLHLLESSSQFYGQPCGWTCLFAHDIGRAMLRASISSTVPSTLPSTESSFILKADFPIAAYSPLAAFQAGNGNKFGGYWIDISEINNKLEHSSPTVLNELYLAPGSAMMVYLCGGPERWNQYVVHVESVEVISEKDLSVADGVQVEQLSSNGRRLYTVACLSLGKFKLLFSRGNLVGVNHPIPTIANLDLYVICNFPSSIILVANEHENTYDVLKAAANTDRGPGQIQSSTIRVAHGCTIRIAAVGIHNAKRFFANSSSLCLSWELVGCEDLAYWSEDGSCKRSVDGNWERFLVLNNTPGLCTVRASVTGFSESMASHPLRNEYLQLESTDGILTDALQLQLVSSIRVVPKFLLVIFDPEAKINLSIYGGTCFLDTVSNDTRVAHIAQSYQKMKCSHLIVSPRGLGTALMTVTDIGLSPPVAAYSLVKVANVEWIKVACEEEISLMEGTIRAFDIIAGTNDGYVFESSQFEFMHIHAHLDDGILEVIGMDNTLKKVIVGPKFSIRAASEGITTFSLSVRQTSGHERLSQTVKVEVYKPLQVHPDYIYLAPGASYVFTVKGGPITGGFIEFASMHEETAVIQDSSGELSAISTGNTSIRAAVYGQNGNLICEAYSRVEVGIPSTMFLSSQSNQLCIGCEMPVFPSFLQGDLFSFYEVCNYYEWNVENEKIVQTKDARSLNSGSEKLQLQCAEGWATSCSYSDSAVGFIKTIIGRSSGKVKISLSFSCDFLLSGVTQAVHYTASKTLTVVPDPPLALGMPATWVIPPFYTTSDLLPTLTDTAGIDSHSHRKGIIYSALRTCERKQDSITIHGGKIRTRDSDDIACIQGRDQTTQRTEIAACVRVAQVSQVRVSSTQSSFHSAYLDVNKRLELIVNYCDELGFTFIEANGVASLDLDINYPHVLSIQVPDDMTPSSEKIFLQARGSGRALARVSIRNNPNKADYILVSVGAHLYPQNPIFNVGHSMNFSVTSDDGLLVGQWLCSNESVLTVNKFTGEAYACAEGRAQVFFQGFNMKLQTMVTVLKLNQITVGAPSETLTNAVFPSKGYKFAVKFSDLSSYKSKYSGDHIEIPFECRVDPSIIGYAKPWTDAVLGDNYCLFFPYTPRHLQINFSKSKDFQTKNMFNSEGFMPFSIIAALKEAPHVTGLANALFVGGFSINIEKLNLAGRNNQSRITITGNADLEVYWNVKDLLLVTLVSKEGSGIGGIVEYEVKVLISQSFRDKIIFILPATGQTAEVDVIYENETDAHPATTSYLLLSAAIICLIVLILTVFLFVKLTDRHSRLAASSLITSTTSAALAAPLIAEPSSAPANIRLSPRTPQPFVEYVRRTIDETPYYKRNARRRFDPQLTY